VLFVLGVHSDLEHAACRSFEKAARDFEDGGFYNDCFPPLPVYTRFDHQSHRLDVSCEVSW